MIDKNDPRLTAYFFGELTPEESIEVEDALAESPELQSELESIRATSELLANEFASQSDLGIGDTRRSAIVQAIDGGVARSGESNRSEGETADPRSPLTKQSSLQKWWVLAVAAAIALMSIPLLQDFSHNPQESAKAPGYNTERGETEKDAKENITSAAPIEKQELLANEVNKFKNRFESATDAEAFDLGAVSDSATSGEAGGSGGGGLGGGGGTPAGLASANGVLEEAGDSENGDRVEQMTRELQVPKMEEAVGEPRPRASIAIGGVPQQDSKSSLDRRAGGFFEAVQGGSFRSEKRLDAAVEMGGGISVGGGGGSAGMDGPDDSDQSIRRNQAQQENGNLSRLGTFDSTKGKDGRFSGRDRPSFVPRREANFARRGDNLQKAGQKGQSVDQPAPGPIGSQKGEVQESASQISERPLGQDPSRKLDSQGRPARRRTNERQRGRRGMERQADRNSSGQPGTTRSENKPDSDAEFKESGGSADLGEELKAGNSKVEAGKSKEVDSKRIVDRVPPKAISQPSKTKSKSSKRKLDKSNESKVDSLEFELNQIERRVEDSEFRFDKKTTVKPVQKSRKETRKRIVQTEDGPKEVEFSVDVPFVEQVQLNTLTIDESEAQKLVQKFAVLVDPSGKQEILSSVNSDSIQPPVTASGKLGIQFFRQVDEEVAKAVRFRKLTQLETKLSRQSIMALVRKKLAERNTKVQAKKSWKRVRATPNTSRLMVGDKDELAMNGMQVNVHVEGYRARVLVDCLYYNDRNRQHEGNFKIRLPDDSSLYYFAFGQSTYRYQPNQRPTPKDIAANEFESEPQLVSFAPEEIRRARRDNWAAVKESRMVTKEKAANAYNQTIRRRIDPALVEWSGGGIFNARVFPLMPQKMHRIVLGYDVDLRQQGDDWAFDLDLPEEKGACQVHIHVADLPGATYQTVPAIDPIESNYLPLSANERRQVDGLEDRLNQLVNRFGKSHPQVGKVSRQLEELRKKLGEREGDGRIWRTFSVTQPETNSIRLNIKSPPVTILQSKHEDEQSYFAYRGAVNLVSKDHKDRASEKRISVEGKNSGNEQSNGSSQSPGEKAIFLLDTSLSSRPDKFNVWLKLLEANLVNNQDSIKEFAVLFFSVDQHLWKPSYAANTAENRAQLLKDCEDLALEGATDLYAAVQRIQLTPWMTESNARPNVFLLSDGNSNWGESNLRMLAKLLDRSKLGSLFAYQTGFTGTAIGSLRFLASESGGAVFSVVNETEIAAASTAHRARPWRVDSIQVENGSDVMTAGRLQWVYPQQVITLAGRVENNAQSVGKIKLQLSQGENRKEWVVEPAESVATELADRIYGQISVDQLESLGESLVDVSAAYARHFRITGETCSLLMLESEAEYKRFNIVPKNDKMVVATREANELVSKVLSENAADLSSPTAQFRAWVRRLETMEGMQLELPTSLKLLLEEVEMDAVTGALDTTYQKSKLDRNYLTQLRVDRVDYQAATKEAVRRLERSSDDAVKAVSSLIEANPGDYVLARDVAFSALEWKHPAHAFHLLRRVAESRPFDAATYPAIAKCLVQVGELDAAMVFYEIALAAKFNRAGNSYRKIVAFDYSNLLSQIGNSDVGPGLKKYAAIRATDLADKYKLAASDLVVTMMWNTDQTDVDLHVVEPSGEECFYQHKTTRAGGQITDDITTGFGPEMYVIPKAPEGTYKIYAKYFRNNSSRTARRGKVYLEIIRNYGRDSQMIETKTISIEKVGVKNKVLEVEIE